MGKSIGSVALLERIKERMSELICEKNRCLCKGLPVEGINKKLKVVYAYWVLFNDCSMTDDQVNCILKDVTVKVDYSIAKPL